MEPAVLEPIYVVASASLVASGLVMVALAARAYYRTGMRAMVFLTAGFSLVVAAAAATAVAAYLSAFEGGLLLLTVNFVVTTAGYVVIIYSVTLAAR